MKYKLLIMTVFLTIFIHLSAYSARLSGKDSFSTELDKELNNSRPQTNTQMLTSPINQGSSHRSITLSPDMFLALDMLFIGGPRRTDTAPNQAMIRSLGIGFKANIDPYFFGTIIFSFEYENSEFAANVEEAWIRYSGLLPGVTVRAGRLFMDLGIQNTIHQHDRLFCDSPLVQAAFLGEESAADVGADINSIFTFLPFYLRLNIGVFDSRQFGEDDPTPGPKRFPLFTTKLETFLDINSNIGIRLGINHLIRPLDKSSLKLYQQLLGFDFTLKAYQRKEGGFLLLSEFWHRRQTTDGEQTSGLYVLAALRFETNYETDIRYDYLKTVELTPAIAYSAFFTLRPSAFSYIRLQYKYLNDPQTADTEHLLYLQISYIMGAHPAHRY